MRPINPLASLSIKHKLSLISIVPTAALVLAFVVFVAYDYTAVRNGQLRSDQRVAEALGVRISPTVSTGNDRAARQMLTAFDRNPNVTRAYVFAPDGRVFAKYVHPGVLDTGDPPPSASIGQVITWDRIGVYQPLTLGANSLGTLYVESDRGEQYPRLQRSSVVIVVLLVASLLVGLGVSSALQQIVSGPIVRLSETARRVSAEKDYAIRVQPSGADEVGALISGFNDMLEQIQHRDEMLREHHERLEGEVASRTRELTTLNR
jgi:methyl-accepting chemotaxis protein